jgi:osmoprotectant transport system substrate-binding protein
MNSKRYVLGATAATLATIVLAACGSSSNPTGGSSSAASSAGSSASSETVKIGSANFTESTLLADIYSSALKAKGVTVTITPNIGSREVYVPALKDGSIDLIGDYSGELLAYLSPTATAVSSDDVYTALQTAVPAGLTVLKQAPAQDTDQIVVTQATATKYNLKTIADLAPVASKLTFGGPAEFSSRHAAGLKAKYGVTFGTYKTLDAGGPLSVNGLKNGQVDASDIFSTDASMTTDNFVALTDPKNEFTAQNLIPLISKAKATPTVTAALNAVSAKLDTATLTSLDAKVDGAKQNPATVASDWVKSVGLS